MFSVSVSGNDLIIGSNSGELFRSDPNGGHFDALPKHLKVEPVMSWVADDDTVFLTQFDPERKTFNLSSFHEGQLIPLGPLDGNLVPNAPDIAISKDRKWLLYSRQETAQSDLMIRRSVE